MTGTGRSAEEIPPATFVRRPSDALRLVIALLLLLLGVLVALVAEDAVATFEANVLTFLGTFAGPVQQVLAVSARVVSAVLVLVAAVVLLVLRNWRVVGYMWLASLTGVAARAASTLIERVEPASFAAAARTTGLTGPADAPALGHLATVVAVVTVLAPWLKRSWRRIAWLALAVTAAARMLTSTLLPATAVFEAAFGWAAGCVVLLAFGAPNPRPRNSDVRRALDTAGLPVATLDRAQVDARGSTPYAGVTTRSQRIFAKVLSQAERDADLLFRLYRWLRFRHVGDKSPFMTVRRQIEHEALLALAARDCEVRTPRVLAIGAVPGAGEAMVLAYERLAGGSLDSVDPAALTDQTLRDVWQQVALLRRRRIAHRDLRLANVFLDDAGQVWLIDFGFSELAVDDALLADDVTGLLAATAVVVGPQRAVAAACATVGPRALAAALPRLQPEALSRSTRDALHRRPGLLDELRRRAQQAASVDEVRLERLERISRGQVLGVVVLGAAFYFLLPQLTDASEVLHRLASARPFWAVAAVVGSAASYVGATLSLAGAVPEPLPPGGTFLTQLASSFSNRITPAQAGGYALNLRFLQRRGVPTPVALTGVGLNSLGGPLVHLPMLAVFTVWAGSDGFGRFDLPHATVFLLVAGVVILAGGVVATLPVGRRVVIGRVVPATRTAASALGEVARRPERLIALLGGSALVTGSYLLAFAASVHAFGGGITFAQTGLVYLAASVVASAAPTPGGLGAAEAAYAAGLSAAGLDHAAALSAVFLFRGATFWLPILPGWLALHILRARGAL